MDKEEQKEYQTLKPMLENEANILVSSILHIRYLIYVVVGCNKDSLKW